MLSTFLPTTSNKPFTSMARTRIQSMAIVIRMSLEKPSKKSLGVKIPVIMRRLVLKSMTIIYISIVSGRYWRHVGTIPVLPASSQGYVLIQVG